MPRSSFSYILVAATLLACVPKPPEGSAAYAPGGQAWVRQELIPPSGEERRTLRRFWLETRFGRLVLLEGLAEPCGLDTFWEAEDQLRLRLPVPLARHLKVVHGQRWRGIGLSVEQHEDQLRMSSASPDGQRRLIVVYTCRDNSWMVYLRRAGEPNYNAAMDRGWGDPNLFGGFDYQRVPLELVWTGPRSARLRVRGGRAGVTVKEHCGDVDLKWEFVLN